ncbi:DUF4235 domain-containing protein [Cellulosimicrobium marinum]|uniref:DUF4235 domain-containing protein n=1 Tax=Cellulosimicrobium marinum TaxID=1638992 RepID=UPI001E545574|nr:DUF4235 domain-containing protein [Cellulosimicrobium marinum]MCB7136119.1 DUF4235 domain-containing protein [Cellulosimicrobium marinum]
MGDASIGDELPEKDGGKAAKILYRPVGIASSIVGGLVAGQVFKQVYKRVGPGDRKDAPTPLQSEYPLKEILLAAMIQGAIYAVVKALIDRGGARAFEKWTGEWPGD